MQLQAINLKKKYGKYVAVNDVSLEVFSGEIVGLLGANGAGKTTAFYMLAGLIQPNEGYIFIDNKNITRKSIDKRVRLGMGYLPQESSIFQKMTVEDNILSIAEFCPYSKRERENKVNTLLNDLQIAHIRNKVAVNLSGGEKRRVEIARSLITDPKFILLDEPFAGVDPIAVSDIQNLIISLTKKNIGVFITDHNIQETLSITQRVYIMNRGKIITQGSPTDIINNPLVQKYYIGKNFAL